MKICNDCKKELPDDSEFCQFCGSKNITLCNPKPNNRVYKRCIDCGKELPEDSDFCQYCGSKRVAVVNDADEQKKKASVKSEEPKKFKRLFIASVIVAICSLCGLAYFASMNSELNSNIATYISKNESLEKQIKTKENELSKARTKASNYDTIKNNARNTSNSNFFATQTVLKNPNKTRVVFYIPTYKEYSIKWSYSSEITATSGNTSSGLVYLDVTYNGSGVGTIECTNTINSSKIIIYCIGS